jgi:hypothetical protein
LPSPAALRACRSRRERGRVTVLRNISGKFSGSRNTGSDLTEYDPDTCLFCRKRFDRGQMRYPIRNWEAWEPDFGSVCMPCFKDIDDPDYTSKQERYERDCNGCGEPILTPTEGVFRWQVCSKRCYQRALRNRNGMFRIGYLQRLQAPFQANTQGCPVLLECLSPMGLSRQEALTRRAFGAKNCQGGIYQ